MCGSSAVKRGHNKYRLMSALIFPDGLPRCLGGCQEGGGTR